MARGTNAESDFLDSNPAPSRTSPMALDTAQSSVCISVFIHKMGIMIGPASNDRHEDKTFPVYKPLLLTVMNSETSDSNREEPPST